MSSIINAEDIGAAWLSAYQALIEARRNQLVNLIVTIRNPLTEDLGVRSALERDLSRLRLVSPRTRWKSVHTVANTIFPISLYHPDLEDAASRFFRHCIQASNLRPGVGGWGTYIGRLVNYRCSEGKSVNQLEQVLTRLRAERQWSDLYEVPVTYPTETLQTGAIAGDIHLIGPDDRRYRGGPCLAHVSFTATDGKLHMTALYRRQSFVARAYGNYLGLARLLYFLSRESDRMPGELVVIATHAEIEDAPGRAELLDAALREQGLLKPIETASRGLGAAWRDLDLPVGEAAL